MKWWINQHNWEPQTVFNLPPADPHALLHQWCFRLPHSVQLIPSFVNFLVTFFYYKSLLFKKKFFRNYISQLPASFSQLVSNNIQRMLVMRVSKVSVKTTYQQVYVTEWAQLGNLVVMPQHAGMPYITLYGPGVCKWRRPPWDCWMKLTFHWGAERSVLLK